MSHFTVIKTRLVEQDALVLALADLGYNQVEVHETAQNLVGYRGDIRPETAEVIVRREWVGPASNDIGFKRGPDGVFQAIISEFDRELHGEKWLNQLSQRYAYNVAKAKMRAQGFDLVAEETQAGGEIRLVLRKVAP